jgi:hypothetical protein
LPGRFSRHPGIADGQHKKAITGGVKIFLVLLLVLFLDSIRNEDEKENE